MYERLLRVKKKLLENGKTLKHIYLIRRFLCKIAEYFYELCCILVSSQGKSKYEQRVKISGDTTQQKRRLRDLLLHTPNCYVRAGELRG